VSGDGPTRRVACPVCGSADVERRGRPRYRQPARVAGVPIRLDDLDLMMYRCARCTYQFVWPPIPQQRLLGCYAAAGPESWPTVESVAAHRGYALKRRLLERYAPGRRVVDFGCFDGGFLQYLGDGWAVAGIEPSSAAAGRARERGVRVLGPTIEAVGPGHAGAFDAVVIFDVMEHLSDPVGVLRSLAGLLAPGGIMLIETGNTEASHWRLAGSDYWYCGIVGHVGFFNRRSIRTAGERAGLDLAHFERSVHYRVPLRERARAPLVTVAYYAVRALRAAGVPTGPRLDQIASGASPTCLDGRDHFLAVLRKAR
jgi:SAM-dependent methyltransferase